ncbi:MAG: response regulator transcription factor [Ignavibacteriales bacterium]|nr:response regulator transcription factor [Ignavibacteriales bacterium]
MENSEIKISVVEDHHDFREGLVNFINFSPGYNCVGKFSSVESALEGMVEPHVVLLDINLPGKSGIEAIPLFKEMFPALKVIMMTIFDDSENIFKAMQAGADGYLLKNTAPLKIIASIDEVMNGGAPMSPYIARKVVDFFCNQSSSGKDYDLTLREKEILSFLVEGIESRTIAENLFISYETVRNHLRNIYSKLQVTSKTQAVSKALRENLIK